jgi:predicted O-linked N-acetylglucosamine transferase (SPINDLY family)
MSPLRSERPARRIGVNLNDQMNDRGVQLARAGDFTAALALFDEAIAIQPEDAAAHRNRGNALARLGRLVDAERAYRRSLSLRPGDIGTWEGLSAVCHEFGDARAVVECLRHLARLQPNDPQRYSALLYALHYLPEFGQPELLEAHGEWSRHFDPARAAKSFEPRSKWKWNRTLRVGYLSAGFREHPVARFQLNVLRAHDRSRVEVFGYVDHRAADAWTAACRRACDESRTVVEMTDDELSAQIGRDAIDLLVDLHGTSTGNRLGVFVRRPAPVQVAYNGYIGTSGLSSIAWRITDAWHDPPELQTDRYHTERLWRIPGGMWAYTPDNEVQCAYAQVSEAVEPPVVRNGYITFGCLNQLLKASPPSLRAWALLLEAVPKSRLLLASPSKGGVPSPEIAEAIEQRGGPPADRITILPRAPNRQGYLDRHRMIDIALDPWPFNGITTTCDALWMGVPVVTLAGNRFSGRAGVSILNSANQPELIAPNAENYIRSATELAADVPRLVHYRRNLREQLVASPLCSGTRVARALEDAFEQMVHKA